MMNCLLLLDAAPEPAEMGAAGLILIAIVVVLISAAAIVGFCVLVAMAARKRATNPNGDDELQASNPNQP